MSIPIERWRILVDREIDELRRIASVPKLNKDLDADGHRITNLAPPTETGGAVSFGFGEDSYAPKASAYVVTALDGTLTNESLLVGGTGIDVTGASVAIDSSVLTTSTGLQAANNLSDLASASTARTNLGLGTAAVAADTAFVAVTGDTMTGTLTMQAQITSQAIRPDVASTRDIGTALLPYRYGYFSADLAVGGTVDGRDIATDGTKLDGIEALADVTDAANVAAAGAVMESDATTAAMGFVIDEDDMVSDSDTKVPTQQSVKAYVDAAAGGGGGMNDLVDDLTPTLGGALDAAQKPITDVIGFELASPAGATRYSGGAMRVVGNIDESPSASEYTHSNALFVANVDYDGASATSVSEKGVYSILNATGPTSGTPANYTAHAVAGELQLGTGKFNDLSALFALTVGTNSTSTVIGDLSGLRIQTGYAGFSDGTIANWYGIYVESPNFYAASVTNKAALNIGTGWTTAINANGLIKNVTDPASAQDAATKAYVDAATGGATVDATTGVDIKNDGGSPATLVALAAITVTRTAGTDFAMEVVFEAELTGAGGAATFTVSLDDGTTQYLDGTTNNSYTPAAVYLDDNAANNKTTRYALAGLDTANRTGSVTYTFYAVSSRTNNTQLGRAVIFGKEFTP